MVALDGGERAKEYFKGTLKKWHDNKIDYVFLTETAAISHGYALKEAWKQMYPGQAPPKFYRIDPQIVRNKAYLFGVMSGKFHEEGFDEQHKKTVEIYRDFFKKRIKKDNARIVVYDEAMSMYHPEKDTQLKKFHQTQSRSDGSRLHYDNDGSLNTTANFLHDAYKSGLIDKKPGEIFIAGSNDIGLVFDPDERPTSKKTSARGGYRKDSEDEKYRQFGGFKSKKSYAISQLIPSGWIVKHPLQRRRAREAVREAKKYGRNMGEIIGDQDSGQTLEGKVTSAIAIGTLIISVLFGSNFITGNAIGVNQNSSNWVSGIFFLIGIIASFLYFKKRK